ncbi:MAG TPA: PIN domain-containing protein [Terriglobales bacterium]|nr:PIN domain-containing protein [Terriglobales bacterium]
MPPAALIDTGPIVAMLDGEDYWHRACVQALQSVRTPVFTTEAVLTEAFHLIGSNSHFVQRLWTFIRSGAVTVKEISDRDLPALHSLMTKYGDCPMDFSDATLVHIANLETTNVILTVDFSDFETYRLRGNKRFNMLPGRQQ